MRLYFTRWMRRSRCQSHGPESRAWMASIAATCCIHSVRPTSHEDLPYTGAVGPLSSRFRILIDPCNIPSALRRIPDCSLNLLSTHRSVMILYCTKVLLTNPVFVFRIRDRLFICIRHPSLRLINQMPALLIWPLHLVVDRFKMVKQGHDKSGDCIIIQQGLRLVEESPRCSVRQEMGGSEIENLRGS